MLVITRKEQQIIHVEDVQIKVLSVKGGTVKIGIQAHPCVKILRDELKKKDEAEKEEQCT